MHNVTHALSYSINNNVSVIIVTVIRGHVGINNTYKAYFTVVLLLVY